MGKEKILLSRSDLAKRWGISTATVDRRAREGFITPVQGYKVPVYNLYDILKIEGTDTSELSPYERMRLQRTNKELEQRVAELEKEKEELKRWLTNVAAEILSIINEQNK